MVRAGRARRPSRTRSLRALDDGWDTGRSRDGGDRPRTPRAPDRHHSIAARLQRSRRSHRARRASRLRRVFRRQGREVGRAASRHHAQPRQRHDLRSVTKSVVSALVGHRRGVRRDPIARCAAARLLSRVSGSAGPRAAPDHDPSCAGDERGLEWNEDVPYNDPKNDEIAMGRAADPIRYVLARADRRRAGHDVALQRRHHTGARRDRAEGDGEAARGVRAGGPCGRRLASRTSSGSAIWAVCRRRPRVSAFVRAISRSSDRCICTTDSGTTVRSCRRTGLVNPRIGR